MAVSISTYPNSNSTRCDLLYSVLLALGGTMNDVQQLYNNSQDDLLFAILTRLNNGGAKITIQPTLVHPCNGTEGNTVLFPELANIPRSQIISINRSSSPLHVITAGVPHDLDALYTTDDNGGLVTLDVNAPLANIEFISVVFFN